MSRRLITWQDVMLLLRRWNRKQNIYEWCERQSQGIDTQTCMLLLGFTLVVLALLSYWVRLIK